ncbi:hypothetical protein RchiOBHm_Chr7g0179371 [Rosa chinensis]|uniref:Uncharacterized protein n=1 Tax=Rosa chinensis TaxID=74649 RepID=A0A2P6P229_ROSCH|nr:hypothetical protein RchiOBHm_Chr7g0179371 [Rosa chinensis]
MGVGHYELESLSSTDHGGDYGSLLIWILHYVPFSSFEWSFSWNTSVLLYDSGRESQNIDAQASNVKSED